MQVVWFKRDLRITDHAPLRAAALAGAEARRVFVQHGSRNPDREGVRRHRKAKADDGRKMGCGF
ncbi:MAG: deoxyribodipyrimidine photo-lyase [Methyloversatilis sp.]|uniref:deoxyribodipyrimidine photo-lyase n=1 Tax=Methyloversatilis sp. TaxID=2569862 RepID=UPI0027366173|nr:deoxyribodipyrimidine photo-lyase [Methyloversatilis sp.]MDP3874057.1 deoxyribodipyrimidine photo-lyase [Methyloversatilis sp.]